jgi:Fe2+ or Zn2+ uptake regulation protein
MSTAQRLAKNYRLVYDVVRKQGHGRHLATADVFKLVKRRRVGIGFTTVYRALAKLRDLGLISEIHLPGADSAYYEPAGDPHAHFRCDLCGSVKDIAYVPSKRVVAQLAERNGVSVSDVILSLHGRCASCRERESA